MLRITISTNDQGATSLLLEGRLVGAWVAELERSIMGEPTQAPAHLELDGLTFADSEGVRLLRELRGRGVDLRGASSFMLALIGEDDGGTRTAG